MTARLRVIFTQSAWSDLEEISAYWTERSDPSAARDTRMTFPLKRSGY